MSDVLLISRDSSTALRVQGCVDVRNAASALARGDEIVVAGARVELDVSGLQSADSVTVSVLLAWAARAARQGGSLQCTNVPPRLLATAHLCKAERLLGIAAD